MCNKREAKSEIDDAVENEWRYVPARMYGCAPILRGEGSGREVKV